VQNRTGNFHHGIRELHFPVSGPEQATGVANRRAQGCMDVRGTLPGIFVTALRGETFPLFRNEGNRFFSSDDFKPRIRFQSMRMSGLGAGIYDFDNDGYKDLFTANSQVNQVPDPESEQEYMQANAVFRNLHNGGFKDVSSEAGPDMKVRAVHRGPGSAI
jgi:hypothetical protein